MNSRKSLNINRIINNMRVILLAATNQKASIADKLIQDPRLSKIVLSIQSKKLVTQAQGIIIYFESQEDLERMGKLLKIYSGVPLKFYFGPKKYMNFQHFYKFEDAKTLIADLISEFKTIGEYSETIYTDVLLKDDKGLVTVDSMISNMPKSKDIIEDYCMDLFNKKGKKKQKETATDGIGKNVLVDKKKFCRWWSEGNLDHFEIIKYYLIGWMSKQLKLKKLTTPELAK